MNWARFKDPHSYRVILNHNGVFPRWSTTFTEFTEAWIGLSLKILSLIYIYMSCWCCGSILISNTIGYRFEPFYCDGNIFFHWNTLFERQRFCLLHKCVKDFNHQRSNILPIKSRPRKTDESVRVSHDYLLINIHSPKPYHCMTNVKVIPKAVSLTKVKAVRLYTPTTHPTFMQPPCHACPPSLHAPRTDKYE